MKKKKAKRKLRLAKQTIRRLGEVQLDGAIGAGTNLTYYPTLANPNLTITTIAC